MTDKFEEFESNIYNWVSRHKLGLMVVGFLVVLWVVLSIVVVSWWGLIGAANMESLMTRSYNGEVITYNTTFTNSTYDTMKNVIIPVSVQMFNTIGWVILVLMSGYAIVALYMVLKYVCRRYKNV